MGQTSFEKRDFTTLLIRDRENILQLGVAIAELVSPSLLCLYPLPSSGLLPGVCQIRRKVSAHVFVVRVVRTSATVPG
jgi:hypothetical protein